MEYIQTAKNVLSQMIENSDENGVTEGQVVKEIVRYDIGYYEALDSLRKVYREVGAERTPEHTGEVIRYKKAKQNKQQEESMAVRLAKKIAGNTVGERERLSILNYYRR